jgi:lipopolysaccharide/colanic/teichoic acid biosynthesis glycosyltransferase
MKRIFDLIITITLLFLLIPLFLLISILIFLFQSKSVLFFQERLGKNHLKFKIIKFRTMTNELNSEGQLLPDVNRTTKIGNFLRKSSLDELPGLFNVLKGEMSLVGPRPLPIIYGDRYSPEENRRHEIKPGITGWAQVNGRNAISWKEKFKLDVWYVDNKSFFLDIKILILTFYKVILRKDIVPDDKGAMEEFLGNK